MRPAATPAGGHGGREQGATFAGRAKAKTEQTLLREHGSGEVTAAELASVGGAMDSMWLCLCGALVM